MDQMEKKQITNSSTVSRVVKDPHGDRAGSLPGVWELATLHLSPLSFHKLFPQKGREFVTFLWSTHFSAGSPPGPQGGFGSPFKSRMGDGQ